MATLEQLGEVISADILVIGGGLSGVLAAIKAKEHKESVDVLIVDRATVGWGSQAAMSAGGTLILPPQEDAVNSFIKWAVSYGEYLNDQDWLHAIAHDVWGTLKELADWGLYLKTGDNPLAEPMPSLHTQYLFAQAVQGNFVLASRNRARKLGVRMLNKIAVVDLLKQDGRVVGAVGFNIIDGRFYIFKSKATILANGGCDFRGHRLFNSAGESIAMAYRAGAELRNAEFGNFYTIGLRDYDIYIFGFLSHYLFNALGENVSDKYKLGETEDCRKLILSMSKEVNEGRGPIYLDMSTMPEEDRDIVTHSYMIEEFKKLALAGILPPPDKAHPSIWIQNWLWETYKKVGIDPFSVKLEAKPNCMCNFGPIRVNLEAGTTVPGLWAIGANSTGGAAWTGAINAPGQLKGAATLYCLISGFRAGPSAAAYASRISHGKVNAKEVSQLKTEIFAAMKRSKGLLPADAIYGVQEMALPVRYNLLRSEERLKEALVKIKELQQKCAELWAKDTHELYKCYQAKSMALCAEVIFKTALMRTESRGFHIREDYPQRDDRNWLKWIIVKKEGEKMALSTEPVPLNKYKIRP